MSKDKQINEKINQQRNKRVIIHEMKQKQSINNIDQ